MNEHSSRIAAGGDVPYPLLAALLEYPTAEWHDLVEKAAQILAQQGGSVASAWTAFFEAVQWVPIDQMQERYVQTFELSSNCTLEAGYHLFGDTYKRGEFLAHLRKEQESIGVDGGRQLPDYLPLLLRMVPRIEDAELREALRDDCILPAVRTMTDRLEAAENPYRALLGAVGATVGLDAADTCCTPHSETAHA